MALLRGPDEVVVRAIETLDHRPEYLDIAVDQFTRRDAFPRRGLLDLLAVLVGAREKIDVVAVKPHETGDGVGRDHLIGVTDVRRAVRVGDRGGDVKRLRHDFSSSCPALCRASTTLPQSKTWMAGTSPAMTGTSIN